MPDALTAAADFIDQCSKVEMNEPLEIKPGVVEALKKAADRARNELDGMNTLSSRFTVFNVKMQISLPISSNFLILLLPPHSHIAIPPSTRSSRQLL